MGRPLCRLPMVSSAVVHMVEVFGTGRHRVPADHPYVLHLAPNQATGEGGHGRMDRQSTH